MDASRWMLFVCGILLVVGGVAASIDLYRQLAVLVIPGAFFMFLAAVMENEY